MWQVGFKHATDRVNDETLELYDANINTWTTKAPMPTTRAQMGGAVINGKLYVVGGTTSGGAAGAVRR